MSTYARIADGSVVELFTVPKVLAHLPISDLFHPELVWSDVTDVSPQPAAGWSAASNADGTWSFSAPPTPALLPPPPAPAWGQMQAQLAALMTQVQSAMAATSAAK